MQGQWFPELTQQVACGCVAPTGGLPRLSGAPFSLEGYVVGCFQGEAQVLVDIHTLKRDEQGLLRLCKIAKCRSRGTEPVGHWSIHGVSVHLQNVGFSFEVLLVAVTLELPLPVQKWMVSMRRPVAPKSGR